MMLHLMVTIVFGSIFFKEMKDKLHNYIIKKSKHKVKEWKNIKTIISFKQHNST